MIVTRSQYVLTAPRRLPVVVVLGGAVVYHLSYLSFSTSPMVLVVVVVVVEVVVAGAVVAAAIGCGGVSGGSGNGVSSGDENGVGESEDDE